MLRTALLTIQCHYCFKNEIDHCQCSNLGVISLACNDITVNKFYQLILARILVWGDTALIFFSQCSNPSHCAEAELSRNNDQGSEYLQLLPPHPHSVLQHRYHCAVTYLAEKKIPLMPVLLNVLHNVSSPALNPMVYALRMHEFRLGFQRLLRLGEDVSTK